MLVLPTLAASGLLLGGVFGPAASSPPEPPWPAASDHRTDSALDFIATHAPDTYARMRRTGMWAIGDCKDFRRCRKEVVASTTKFDGDPTCWTLINSRNEAAQTRELDVDRLRFRAWVLVYEAEHCKGVDATEPDERPALDAQHDFAVELGDRRLLHLWRLGRRAVDADGQWRE